MPLCVLEITYSVTVLKQGLFLEYVGSTGFNSRLPAYKAGTFAAEPNPGSLQCVLHLARPKKRTSDWNIQTLHTVVFDSLTNESIARDSY